MILAYASSILTTGLMTSNPSSCGYTAFTWAEIQSVAESHFLVSGARLNSVPGWQRVSQMRNLSIT